MVFWENCIKLKSWEYGKPGSGIFNPLRQFFSPGALSSIAISGLPAFIQGLCRENTTFLDSEFLPQPGFWRPESGPSWGKNKTQALLFFSQTISFPRSAVSFIASQSNGSDIMAPAAQTIARVGASVEIQKGFYLCRSPRCFLLLTFDLLHNCSVVQKRQHLKHKSTYKLTGRTNLL